MTVVCALIGQPDYAAAREHASASAQFADAAEPNLLLLEVALGRDRLVEILAAYQVGDEILLPVGELARLLTIGITVDRSARTASGFLLDERLPFRLEADAGSVVLPGGPEAFDPHRVRWIDGELYVAAGLLARWWPVDISVDMAALRLNLTAREKLPLQARIERERLGQRLSTRGATARRDPDYPYLPPDYDLLSVPFVDSTLALDVRGRGDAVSLDAAFSALLTGDLLGMEASAHVSLSRQEQEPQARITLARHDPEAGLLGPLGARSIMLGSIGIPAVDNVVRSAGVGNGVLVSNRPLHLPSSARSETLRGELPPGWDVTLYFNEALVGFQQARSDGLYEFADLPLIYGRNEFRLVFNGPLGEARVERKVFEIDDRVIAPGEIFYSAAAQVGEEGGARQALQVDVGVFEDFGVTLGGVYVDEGDETPGRGYANAGARLALPGALVTLDYVQVIDGGSLIDFAVHTSLAGMSLEASRLWMDDYHSDVFVRRSDPIEIRDRLRVIGTLALSDRWKLPMALDLERETYASGSELLRIQHRLSLNLFSTSFTNMLEWRSFDRLDYLGGLLQLSRRVAGYRVSGQAVYSFMPQARLNSVALNIDKSIGVSGRAFVGVLRDLDARRTTLTAGFNRNIGSFGIGISGMFAAPSDYGLGVQLFTAIGRNPYTGGLVADWRPMANSGIVAAQAFIDDNRNGIFDRGEDPVEGVAFAINGGSRHPTRTDAHGVAVLNRLPPRDYVDIVVDASTLADAQLQPAVPGVRVLPRPGKAQKVDIPIALTGEIDGTIYLVEDGHSRGIGDAVVELLNNAGEVIASTRSASDGFYVLSAVKPGRYHVRISPTQVDKLGLLAEGAANVTMPDDPDFISGIDLELRR